MILSNYVSVLNALSPEAKKNHLLGRAARKDGIKILGLLITSPLPDSPCISSFFGARHLTQAGESSGCWDLAKHRVRSPLMLKGWQLSSAQEGPGAQRTQHSAYDPSSHLVIIVMLAAPSADFVAHSVLSQL